MCSYLIAYYIKVQTAANNCDVDKENDEDQLDSLHEDVLVRTGVRSLLQGKKEKQKKMVLAYSEARQPFVGGS